MTYPNSPLLIDPETDRYIQEREELEAAIASIFDRHGAFLTAAAVSREFTRRFPTSELQVKVVGIRQAPPEGGMAYGCSDCFTDVADYEGIPDPEDGF